MSGLSDGGQKSAPQSPNGKAKIVPADRAEDFRRDLANGPSPRMWGRSEVFEDLSRLVILQTVCISLTDGDF
jgi:hypothetical protein